MEWDSKDKALAIQGLGALASAWGQYETDTQRTNLMKEEMEYQKSLDDRAFARADKAQSYLEDAFSNSALNTNTKNKKKKYDIYGVEIVDTTTTV